MYIPQTRERVQIAGRTGVFLVVWVDHDQEEVDLIPIRTAVSAEESVPFSELQPFQDNVRTASTR